MKFDNYTAITPAQKSELDAIRQKYLAYLKKTEKVGTNQILLDLKQLYPLTNQQSKLLQQIADLKACLDSFRPFDTFQIKNLDDYYTTFFTYESNRIEGNSLTHDETHLVINEGLTIGGKPLKDHLEAINHKRAYQYIRDLVAHGKDLDEREVFNIHSLILRTINDDYAGRYRNVSVRVLGSRYVFPNPLKVPDLMQSFLEWYERHKNTLHPVLLAGEVHERLVTIHPFIDGTGRTARLIMNLILLQHGFPIVNISGEQKERQQYYAVLKHAQMEADRVPFLNFILEQEKKSLFHYISMFAGSTAQNDKGYYFFKRISRLFD